MKHIPKDQIKVGMVVVNQNHTKKQVGFGPWIVIQITKTGILMRTLDGRLSLPFSEEELDHLYLYEEPPQEYTAGQQEEKPVLPNITLRDYFAGQALSGISSTDLIWRWRKEDIVEQCDGLADAMLKKREKGV